MSDWQVAGVIGTLFGISVTSLIAVLRERRDSRSELDKQLDTKVNAAIGSVLINIRKLEDDIRESMDGLTDDQQKTSTQLQQLNEDTLQKVNEAEGKARSVVAQLEDYLRRANALFPPLSLIEVLPAVLVAQTRQAIAEGEIVKANAILSQLLDTDNASSSDVEEAADLARRLGNRSLAMKLYDKAVQEDSDNTSAQSELLYLQSTRSTQRQGVIQRLTMLADANPDDRKVIRNLIYALQDSKNITALRDASERIVNISLHKSFIYRHLGGVYARTNEPENVVRETFQKAMDFGRSGLERDFASAAVDYARYLLTLHPAPLDEAESLLNEALREDPLYSNLHWLKGDIHKRRGRFNEALISYTIMAETSGRDRELADSMIQGVIILKRIEGNILEVTVQS